jgi:hypothetical protein
MGWRDEDMSTDFRGEELPACVAEQWVDLCSNLVGEGGTQGGLEVSHAAALRRKGSPVSQRETYDATLLDESLEAPALQA